MPDHALLASAPSNADLAALLCCATAARLSKPLLTTEPVAAFSAPEATGVTARAGARPLASAGLLRARSGDGALSLVHTAHDRRPFGAGSHNANRAAIMATGTVKWFNATKGYGFIQPDQGGKDVFVHISAVERSGMSGLAEGMKVTYDVEADRKSGKESATNLKVA